MDKTAMLREILAANPSDAFARYGLAVELAGRGETAPALAEFERLLADHPDYTAGYFMMAQTLIQAGRRAEAKTRLEAGIECAKRTGNRHAQEEMQGLLEDIFDGADDL